MASASDLQSLLRSGMAHHEAGDFSAAERAYRQVLAVDSIEPNALHLLGVLAHQIGRHEQGAELMRRAITIMPKVAAWHSDLGTALNAAGEHEHAVKTFEHAIRLDPTHTDALHGLGQALVNLQRIEEAIASYQRAIALRPDFASAYHSLALLAARGVYKVDDEQLVQIQRLLDDPSVTDRQASLLHFGLAEVLHKRGEYDQAFLHFRQANEHKRRTTQPHAKFVRQDLVERVDQIRSVFDDAYFARTRGWGVETELPVFIVGMPRCGSTLVEQILASHSQVHGAGELKHISAIVIDLPAKLGVKQKFPGYIAELNESTVGKIARDHLQELTERGGNAERVVDKMLSNFFYVGLIATMFPQARVVHVKRDPLDTCLSCYCQNLKDSYTNDLEDLGFYYQQYERLISHWRQVLPIALFELNYEDLVADQGRLSRQLVEFFGLPWEDQCLRFYESDRAVKTASKLQVHRPIYDSSVQRWRRYERHLAPLVHVFEAGSES